MLGGVFGWGLARNVIALYCFVCRHYPDNPGAGGERPEIYGFGFSRGSFTIRMLVGLIASEGLVTWRNEDELRRNAILAYRHYRATCFPASNMHGLGPYVVASGRWLRDLFLQSPRKYAPVQSNTVQTGRDKNIRVKFLGLFDTVEAYGMPVAELKTGIDRYLWPLSFCKLDLPKIVDHACHALALDEQRATFQPYQWDEEMESQMIRDHQVGSGRLKQVWFAGVHSNIGGGYPEDQLAYAPLEWIMHEAMAQGLSLNADAIAQVEREKSALARMYDSRAGVGVFWRYGPRQTNNYAPQGDFDASKRETAKVAAGKDSLVKWDVNAIRIRPVIHHSVMTRMAFDDGYASPTLPRAFWVLQPDGILKAVGGDSTVPATSKDAVALDNTKPDLNFGAVNPAKSPALLASESADFAGALQVLAATPSATARQLVWDTIWWRRAMTFCIAFLSVFAVLFPWIRNLIASVWLNGAGSTPTSEANGVSTTLSTSDTVIRAPVSLVFDLLGGFIPSYAKPWVDAVRTYPLEFGLILGALWMVYSASGLLKIRILDRARVGWQRQLRQAYIQATIEADAALRDRLRNWTILFGLATFLVAALTWFGIIGDLPNLNSVSAWNATTQLFWIFVVFVFLFIWRWWEHQILVRETQDAKQATFDYLPKTALLKFAEKCRDSKTLVGLHGYFSQRLVPAGFAVILVLGAVFAVNQMAFNAINSAGFYCTGTAVKPGDHGIENLAVNGTFDTSAVCWASGARLLEGHPYEITLTSEGDWFDKNMRADLGGVWENSFTHSIFAPMKRWLFEPYFRPIARIGRLGNNEIALKPAKAVAPANMPRGCDRLALSGWSLWPLAKIPDEDAKALMQCAATPPERNVLRVSITPKTTGELFLYVNDIAFFGSSGWFYRNNRGTATVTVKKLAE